jgi:hypothetical protein
MDGIDGIFGSAATEIDALMFDLYYGKNKWKTNYCQWFSTNDVYPWTTTYLGDDSSAYLSEMAKLGLSVLYKNNAGVIQTANSDIINVPYSNRLKPIQSMEWMRTARNVLVYRVHVWAYNAMKPGATEQAAGASVNTAITASLTSSSNNAYVQNRFMNVVPVEWQPNFCRPSIRINGAEDLFESFGQAFLPLGVNNGNNYGDKGLGLRLPFNHSMRKHFDTIGNIEVKAAVRQLVEVANGGSVNEIWSQPFPVAVGLYFSYQY